MQSFIMRHGEASNQCAISSNSDSLRPLTELGDSEAKIMGKWLSDAQTGVIDIYVSPYLRAQQTCAHVVNILANNDLQLINKPTTLDFITPAGDTQQTHDFIDGVLAQNVDVKKAILLVSHMPFVSFLVGQLTNSQNMPIFATGAIAHINYDSHLMQGQLVDMISPAKVYSQANLKYGSLDD